MLKKQVIRGCSLHLSPITMGDGPETIPNGLEDIYEMTAVAG